MDTDIVLSIGVQTPAVTLLSRERGTALPWPHPTVLLAVSKGKQRRISWSSEDWFPDASKEAMISSRISAMEFDVPENDEFANLSGTESNSDNREETSMSLSGGSREDKGDSFDLGSNEGV